MFLVCHNYHYCWIFSRQHASPHHTEKCYKYFNEKLNWTDARVVCKNANGDLASIHDKETNRFLSPLSRPSHDGHYVAWIGAKRCADPPCWRDPCWWSQGRWLWSRSGRWVLSRPGRCRWRWSDGSPWDFDRWATGKPTENIRNDDYAVINAGQEFIDSKILGFWENTDRTDDLRGAPFFCQRGRSRGPTTGILMGSPNGIQINQA